MTKIKKDFLAKSVGFKKSDLSLKRQMELDTYASKHSFEWLMLALSRRPLEEWEQWGFVLFKKPEFIEMVNGLVASFSKITDADIKNDEAREKRAKAAKQVHYTKEHLQNNWNILKGIDNCDWEYVFGGSSCSPRDIDKLKIPVPEIIQQLELMRASDRDISDLSDSEKWMVVLGIRKVSYLNADKPQLKVTSK